jgi:multidrug efflux system outer membrane protein
MSPMRALSAALVLLSLSGCLLGPDYKRPEIELPKGFNTGDVVTPALSSTPMASVTVKQDWWTQFGDQTLNQLVDRARTENADLQIALGRSRALA